MAGTRSPDSGPPARVIGGGRRRPVRRGTAWVLALQLTVAALVVGWFATGHDSAPDHGLLQLDVLSLHERVDGLDAVEGRPTMVVFTCPTATAPARTLDARYGLRISSDPALAVRVALPLSQRCEDGYLLLDGAGLVRYRSYDPGWPRHHEEQEILLEALSGMGS